MTSLADRVSTALGLGQGITPGEWVAERENEKWFAIYPVGKGRSIAEGIDPADAALLAAAKSHLTLIADLEAERARLVEAQAAAEAEVQRLRGRAAALIEKWEQEAGPTVNSESVIFDQCADELRTALEQP